MLQCLQAVSAGTIGTTASMLLTGTHIMHRIEPTLNPELPPGFGSGTAQQYLLLNSKSYNTITTLKLWDEVASSTKKKLSKNLCRWNWESFFGAAENRDVHQTTCMYLLIKNWANICIYHWLCHICGFERMQEYNPCKGKSSLFPGAHMSNCWICFNIRLHIW